MGAYRSTRSSTGAPSLPSSAGALGLRQAPSSAAPSTRTYGGLSGRISTLAPRPLDPNTSTNLLGGGGAGGQDLSSASILLDTCLGIGGGAGGAGHKRTLSAAGFPDDSISLSNNAIKRPHLRNLSLDGTSPLLLQAELHPASTPRPESPAYEIAVLRTHYDQQLLSEAQKYKKLEQDFQSKCKELDRFNRQRVELLNEWDRLEESCRAKESEWTTKRQALEDQVVRLRSLNSELCNRNDELSSNSTSESAELRGKLTGLEAELAKAKAHALSAEQRVKGLQDEIGSNQAEIQDLQNALEDEQRMRNSASDSALGGEEGKKIAQELARQTGYLRKIEAENAHLTVENGRLTQHAANVELLKEEKRSLEGKLRTLDSLRDQLSVKESQVEELKQKEKGWQELLRLGVEKVVEASFSGAADIDSPLPIVEVPEVLNRTTLPQYLSTLRGTVSGLVARCRTLTSTLSKLKARNVELEEQVQDIDSNSRKSHLELTTLQTSLSRAQKAEGRLQDQVSRLKTILASYQEEEKNHTESNSYSSAHTQRIALLEGELDKVKADYDATQAELETVSTALAEKEAKADGEDLKSKLESLLSDKASLEARVAELTSTTSQLGRELEKVSKENEMLWLRVGRGEFDQEKQRCLVLASNPVSQDLDVRKKTLDALKEENKALLGRVEQLSCQLSTRLASVAASSGEEASSSSSSSTVGHGALVPQSVVNNLKSDLEALQLSIAAKEKSMLRLKQVFSAKANEFREAIQSLFGYKVKFLENGKVKLTSTFNRSTNSTSLIFESERGNVGKMKLMGEAVKYPGLVNLSGLKEYWLDPQGIRQSVPCFLAALNLELYEGCTMAVRRRSFDGQDQDE